jgi:phage terminase Nu1 subunit (DNA packaging protein)
MGDLLGVKELAAKLGLATETVRAYASKRRDRLPPRVRWSATPLWDSDIVERWLAERDAELTAEEREQKARYEESRQKRPPRVRRVAAAG